MAGNRVLLAISARLSRLWLDQKLHALHTCLSSHSLRFVDSRNLTYSIHFSKFMATDYFHEKTDKTRKYSEVRHFRMIRKWPPTVTRRAKHFILREFVWGGHVGCRTILEILKLLNCSYFAKNQKLVTWLKRPSCIHFWSQKNGICYHVWPRMNGQDCFPSSTPLANKNALRAKACVNWPGFYQIVPSYRQPTQWRVAQ